MNLGLFSNEIIFSYSGIYKGNISEQINSFSIELFRRGYINKNEIKDWFQAFEGLRDLIECNKEKKKVIFLDEISWMCTKGSSFIKALEHFWNGWASARKDIMLIICASSTSWIINNIIHSKGGLYNRITCQLFIEPFTLAECEDFSKSNSLNLSRKQIVELYMIFGGVPYYWNYVKKGYSVSQIIDSCFFEDKARLKNEFQDIFSSLFNKPKEYLEIIKALSKKQYGLTRTEIIKETQLIDNGNFTQKIEDLINCGFVRAFSPLEYKKKSVVYQLIDPFAIFHFHFLTKNINDDNFWSNQLNNPMINSWKGLAFERICLLHKNSIKKALGISGVHAAVYPWYCKKDLENGIFGSQIDMIIERKDDIINLIEIKYYNSQYSLTASAIEQLEKKRQDFMIKTKTKSSVHLTVITLNGLDKNKYYKELQSELTVDDLFL